MKKGILAIAAIAFLGGSLFTSCNKKKDWTCECTWTVGTEKMSQSVVLKDTKKKDAEKACNQSVTSIPGVTFDCAIK